MLEITQMNLRHDFHLLQLCVEEEIELDIGVIGELDRSTVIMKL